MLTHPAPLLASAKQWYSAHEVAVILHRTTDTIRQWCREQRIHARDWEIHADEIIRYQNHGLRPSPPAAEL